MEVKFDRILVPMDFSANANRALDYARALAGVFGSRITLLHVVEQSPYEVYQQKGFLREVPQYERVTGFPGSEPKFIIKDVLEETRNRLKELIPQGKEQQYQVDVRHGHAVEEVLAAIKDDDSDLVVICTHGWTGLAHLVMGSTAERVVRTSPVPVLTVHAEQRR